MQNAWGKWDVQPTGELSLTEALLHKIADRSAVVGVVGLGYVGLPFAVEAAKAGFHVLALDIDQKRVDQVNRGENYIGDVDDTELADLVKEGMIEATATFDRVREMDAVVIAVPTPLDKNLIPDVSFIQAVSKELGARIRRGQLVSLESTTYPGTTEEVILPELIKNSRLKVEEDFFLAYSPERVDPGNRTFNTKNTNKVVGGVGPESLKVASALYGATIEQIVPVSCARTAEMAKVFENTFRAVNIGLVNELMLLCDRMGLNIWEVLEAANTKPFGIMRFMPGPGVGGHCIPLDPHFLEWKAREYNFRTRFIELAGEVNRSIPEFVVSKSARVLNTRKKSVLGSRVLILGVSYKRDIDDWRESPSLDIMRLFEAQGATVVYHDPYVPEFTEHGHTHKGVDLTDLELASADLVVIATDHRCVDYQRVVDLAQVILDTRNVATGCRGAAEKVTLL